MSKPSSAALKKILDACPQFFAFMSFEEFSKRLADMGPEERRQAVSFSIANELAYVCQICDRAILVDAETMKLYEETARRKTAVVVCCECAQSLLKGRDNAVVDRSSEEVRVYSREKRKPS